MTEAPAGDADQGSDSSAAQALVLKVLGTIAAGIGVLGFVTFFGGALIWVRAGQTGLPATEAVAAVPRGVLVATGATFLFPAFLVGTGVVALVFLIGMFFFVCQQRKLKGRRKEVRDLRRRAAQLGRCAATAEQTWKAADAVLKSQEEDLAAAVKAKAAAAEIAGSEDVTAAAEIARREDEIKVQRREVARLRAAAEGAASAAGTAKGTAEDLDEETESNLKRGHLQWGIELGVAVVALLIVVPLVSGAILHPRDIWDFLILVIVAVSGTSLTVMAYYSTEKFVWFGVTAVVAVGVPKMQPVAALRSGHMPVVGAYIAGTSESLYLGTFEEDGTPPRLSAVPRSQVTETAIGPLLDKGEARTRAIEMALNECAQEIEEPKPAAAASAPKDGEEAAAPKGEEVEATPKPACSEPQTAALEALLG